MHAVRTYQTTAWPILCVCGVALSCGPHAGVAQQNAPAPAAAPALEVAVQPEADVTQTPAGLFDLHIRQTPLPEALRLLSQHAKRNISTTENVTARVTCDLYQVTFEEALDALVMPAGYTWFAKGKFIYVCDAEERDELIMASRETEVRVFELGFISSASALPVVGGLLSESGKIFATDNSPVPGVAMTPEDYDEALNSGLGGKSRAVGEFIIVRDYPEVLDQIAAVLEQLDVCPRQVLVEAVILRARLSESNALGVDFNALAGIDFRTINSTSVGATNLNPGAVPSRKLDLELGAVASDVSAGIPAGGLSVGVISNNAAVFVRALEQIVDLTIVANPKVLTVNEQPGRVIVGREDGYQTSTVTETTTIQNVEFLQTGTQILFRPFITKDGMVRMDIHPEDSSGGLTPDNLPFKDTTEVTTNVVVKNGHTLVIGGLFREVITSNDTRLPWLGNLPIAGYLFRGKNDQAVREEVIILITPHIIDGETADETSTWAQGEVERRRTLAHRGLLPWGRERLALAHYNWALEHYRADRIDKAMWDLDLALSIYPSFTEASRLRDQWLDTTTTELDMSTVRTILWDLMDETPPEPHARELPPDESQPAGVDEDTPE